VSFEIRRGEVLGIIGRNGAGKSTLLKILSRITEPSTGRVEIRGRVASLLEVGTGFHPELTGRENTYLNGAILGMSRGEVRRKFDEIVAFAEIDKFLDTPVKHYSSGMYMRLAFAVAAHLEPDILIVDEVLAVGDAEFQKKCLGKMESVAGHGRTVLFVSHNLNAVRALCRSAILLDNGKVIFNGSTAKVLSDYVNDRNAGTAFSRRTQFGKVLFVVAGSVSLVSNETKPVTGLVLALEIVSNAKISAALDIRLKDFFGNSLGFGSLGGLDRSKLIRFEEGTNIVRVAIEPLALAKGRYTLSADLTDPTVHYYDRLEDCLSFEVDPFTGSASVKALDQQWGLGPILLRAEMV
jgi:lipopolysaccharide transport system ATP-binding protein